MSKIIGIDLGTTNSCVSVVQQGKNIIIPNQEGGRTTPSIVAFDKKGDRLIGQMARRQATINPKNTINSIKRLMGLSYNDAKKEIDNVPYQIKKSDKGQANVYVQNIDKQFTPQQISAMIIKRMKETAEQYIGQNVEKAIITVPAYFNDDQRTATRDAGKIAGLEVLRIINEPTAAALAYGVQGDKNKKIAVYDFGGGTFDISILDLFDGVIQVLSTNGDTHLGGDDIDRILVDYIVDEFKKQSAIDISGDVMAMQRVKQAAQKAKIQLSGIQSTNVNLPFITANESGPQHLSIDISLAKFQSMVQETIKRTIKPCKTAIKDAKLSIDEIDQVLLVGGSTRIPMVQKIVKEIFNKQPSKSINPDEAVASGAAIQGAILGGDSEVKDLLLLDVTPLSLGIQTVGGVFTKLIEKNTTIPTKKSQVFSTAADNQTTVSIHVLQGQRPMANDNKSLGRFELTGIPMAQRGVPQIQVSFDLDANGIIHVQARDKGTGKSQAIKIERAGQLSDSDIQEMIKDAELHEQQDAEKRQLIEANNKLQSAIYNGQKQLLEYGDKLPADKREQIDIMLKQAKDVVVNTKEQANQLHDRIVQKLQVIGQYIYQQNAYQQVEKEQSQNSDEIVIEQPEVIVQQ